MGFNWRGHCLFSDLGQKVEVEHWAVVFEGVLVKCWFFKERRDNSLLKPVRKNTFTRERFIMLVIGVRKTSRHSLIMKVGQGSKSHDLVGDLDMSFLTSSSVNG